jgi:hypothetical protein
MSLMSPQDVPSSEPAARDEEGDWDTVGAVARGNTSPPLIADGIVLIEAQE